MAVVLLAGCLPNNPYRGGESGANTYYSTFREPPKHLDPAVSYSSNEYLLLGLIYEPPLQYHYLARPYRLIPRCAREVPASSAPGSVGEGDRTVYQARIKPGIFFQSHPCFARDDDGRLLYHDLSPETTGLRKLADLPETGTRELVAADYVTQIKRLADPTLSPGCPILPIMSKYIAGMDAYARALRRDLERERARRRETGGPFYSAEADERRNPIALDLDRHQLPGATAVDRYTLRLVINGRYPQILYWLAMPFFSPMPREAIDFYRQAVLIERNIDLNHYPVGTGPYRMERYDPNSEIVLVRNENFHGQEYPASGEREDEEQGLLQDAGKALPFIHRIVFKLEKEAIPRWVKFLQGYYDASGIPEESFDQAIDLSAEGSPETSDLFRERGLRLEVAVQAATYYFAFNMLDATLGGYSAGNRHVRHAIAIAMNTEERIQIFNNGRGRPAHSLIPPGIFGYEPGREGMDPHVYRWNTGKRRPVRRSLKEARELLTRAGYPGGRDSNGNQLEVRFANAWNDPGSVERIRWIERKLEAIGIRLKNETTDYNRFQEKAQQGNYQLLSWGWLADYPDPENFLFLLYGPNGQVKHSGPNHSNYDSPEFNRLFRELETMPNSPSRLTLIRRAKAIAQRDAPLIWGFHPVDFSLYHSWIGNTKANVMAHGALKYRRLDAGLRDEYRRRHNRPRLIPFFIVSGVLALIGIPALLAVRRRARGSSVFGRSGS